MDCPICGNKVQCGDHSECQRTQAQMDAEEENINEIIQNSESSKTEIVQKLNEIHDTMKEMLSILKVLETKW